jgi:hypothetical protein
MPFSKGVHMPQELPRSFKNVLFRDQWIWQQNAFDLHLLAEDDQDRLLSLPDYTQDPHLLRREWIQYGQEIAEKLEQDTHWLEAQAYWFAVAQLLAQGNHNQPESLTEAFSGVVRTGAYAVGMPLTSLSFREIVEEGLQSLSTPMQQATAYSLIMIGALNSSIFEDLALSNPARIALSQALSPLFSEHQRPKGTHIIFEEAVRFYSQHVNQLRTLIDMVVVNPTVEAVKGQRNKLLDYFNKLSRISLNQDKTLLLHLPVLLGSDLSTYLKAHEDELGEAFEVWEKQYHSFFEEASGLRSHLASCLLQPLLISLERAVHSHLLSAVHARLPDLQIQLLKPQARWQGGNLIVEIKLTNQGVDLARDCQLSLQRSEKSPQAEYLLTFGQVEPGQSHIKTVHLSLPEHITNLSLKGSLEWRDRLGVHQRIEPLKIERQRQIDWNILSDLAPYSIRSIHDPAKLKGRKEQLQELRLGFASGSSFMITGQKRVGKTSLMNVFLHTLRNRQNVLPLYIPIGELSAASGDDLGRLGYELMKRLLEEYEDHFNEPAGIELPLIEEFRESFNEPIARCLRQFKKQHPDLRLIFALDDFDELPLSLFTGPVGKTFFLSLRSQINAGLSFFFIGSERLPTIMKEQAERLNQVKTLKVDYLDREALVALVKEPVLGHLEYTEDALTEIDTWSARNPYFATLICSAIWQRAIEQKDVWITGHDALEAIIQFVKKSSRNSYEHFWSDLPLTNESTRHNYQSQSSYLLLALSKCQPNPLAFADRRDVIHSCLIPDKEVAGLHLQALINNNVIEPHVQRNDLVRIRVPLFTLWLTNGGATELERDEQMKQKLQIGLTMRDELKASEVVAAADQLFYQGRQITTDEVRVWASQFGNLDDQRLMLKLLHRLRDQGLYTQEKLMHALGQLHALIRQRAQERNFPMYLGSNINRQVQNVYVTHADSVGESGSSLARSYRSQNKIPERLCGTPEKIFTAIRKNASTRAILVCLDDFIGSGHTGAAQIQNLMPRLNASIPNWPERVLFIYATIVGFEQGIQFIEEHVQSGIIVLSLKVLMEADKAFSPNNTIFETAEERQRAYTIAYKIGSILQKENPLGWNDAQALVVFPENVPNNTLPIFYRNGVDYNGRPWRALFPRST